MITNNGVMQRASRERIGKLITAATNTQATIENPVSKQQIGDTSSIVACGHHLTTADV
jgi:hypothetical protein